MYIGRGASRGMKNYPDNTHQTARAGLCAASREGPTEPRYFH